MIISDRDIVQPSGKLNLIPARKVLIAEKQGIDILLINEKDTDDKIEEAISSKIS